MKMRFEGFSQGEDLFRPYRLLVNMGSAFERSTGRNDTGHSAASGHCGSEAYRWLIAPSQRLSGHGYLARKYVTRSRWVDSQEEYESAYGV